MGGGRMPAPWAPAPAGPGRAGNPAGGGQESAREVALEAEVRALRAQLQSTQRDLEAERLQRERGLVWVDSGDGVPTLHSVAGVSRPPGPRWWEAGFAGLRRGFTLAYAARAGVGLLSRSAQSVRRGRYRELVGWQLFSEKGLVYREDAVRLGLFVGGFSGVYHAVKVLCEEKGGPWARHSAVLAGAAAGLSVLCQDQTSRRTIALYMLARALQSAYTSRKEKGLWHFWGSDLPHSDLILFAWSCAQVMYAYAIRPETLPPSYWRFIVRSGPIHADVLEACRNACRGKPQDLAKLAKHFEARGLPCPVTEAHIPQVGCDLMHPHTGSCVAHNATAFQDTFRKTFPLYLSLHMVPYAVFNLKRALKQPAQTARRGLVAAVRSSAFIASFVSIYQACVCAYKQFGPGRESKLLFFFSGAVASLAVTIEKQSRRSELGLYVLPRAIDSLFLTLVDKRWMPKVPWGDVLLFSACSATIMNYYEKEPGCLAPLVRTLGDRIVYGQEESLKRVPTITLSPSVGGDPGLAGTLEALQRGSSPERGG